ncbi:unnamed protein product [Ranitomeya imitator]|uniref:Ig-like domain-containing protein n=1 Tax=Ranitomeya imitator TaxID=111125 RepID=A0ABN9MA20_9NEOB|nr:unnamed protein product [Ranitomeya imitator]
MTSRSCDHDVITGPALPTMGPEGDMTTRAPSKAVPEDAILATLFSNVNLTCAGCEGRVSWSSGSLHRSQRPLHKTEGSHLVLSSVAYEDEGSYTCYRDDAPVCSVELLVRDEPQEGTSLSCYHQHPTHNITCEWSPTVLLHPFSTATLVRVRVFQSPLFFPCTYDDGRRTFFCSSLYNEGDSSKQVFFLCVHGRTDSARVAGLEADVRDILQIGPPLNVQVTSVEKHPRKLHVLWSRPEFWEETFYGLKYQVLYQVENSLHLSNYYTAFYGRTKSQHAAFVTVLRKKYANESLWKREKYGLHTDKQCDLREIRSAVREKSRFHTTNPHSLGFCSEEQPALAQLLAAKCFNSFRRIYIVGRYRSAEERGSSVTGLGVE